MKQKQTNPGDHYCLKVELNNFRVTQGITLEVAKGGFVHITGKIISLTTTHPTT